MTKRDLESKRRLEAEPASMGLHPHILYTFPSNPLSQPLIAEDHIQLNASFGMTSAVYHLGTRGISLERIEKKMRCGV